ncbi:MAG: glutamate synthase-related protein [Ignavibacteriales bacterium]
MGRRGGTAASPEITINNFGIPTLYAVSRAERHLRKRGARDKVSLVISGGIRDSGDVLKAVAPGADAVYIGYADLFALIYSQVNWRTSTPGPVPPRWNCTMGSRLRNSMLRRRPRVWRTT